MATLDETFTTYYSTIVIQKPGVELMKDLGKAVYTALLEYKKRNQYLPDLIVLYRDGVGESIRIT